MSTRRIGMVLWSTFPPHIRVEREVKVLMKAGFNVHLLCIAQNGKPAFEVINGLRVHRVGILYGNMFSKFWTALYTLTFSHPLWKRAILRFVNEFKIEVLHVHDLPLINTALKVARKFGIPVVADLHENYPAALQVWSQGAGFIRKLTNMTLFNYSRWIRHEAIMCSEVDEIIVVVDEMKERIIKTHTIPSGKITVITNTEDPEFVKLAKLDDSIVKKYQDKFVISYIGGFGPHRGLDRAIKGMVYVKKEVPDALLLLVGRGEKFIEDNIRKLVRENNLENNVELLNWQPFNKVYSYMYISSIGIVPHNKNEHTDHTIPYKLFQYMMVGKPIVVSDCKPLKRVVKTLNSGLIFEAGNPISFAEQIIELYKNPELANELGENGRKAVQARYNWRMESKELISLYRQLGNYTEGKEI